jgi:DNA polymerase III delta prime subunit
MAFSFVIGNHGPGGPKLQKKLLRHFRCKAAQTTTAGRQFPIALRVDIQVGLQAILKPESAELVGLAITNMREVPTLAQMLGDPHLFAEMGPIQYDEIDVGESVPASCLKNGLWLGREDGLPFAILFAPGGRFALGTGVNIEIAVPAGEPGARFSQSFFRKLELAVSEARTYRGRVISLEAQIQPFGGGSSVKVHRLAKVRREDVILPQKTMATLDRNVAGFLEARNALKAMRFQSRKGVLFFGPPGTGKTHTIHYLASQLPNHTTLLVTAGQVALLGEYFRLARFLQPSLMVIEDIDLIARERTQMRGPFEELLLNQLLNEMDGLREDADVLFILTTNRPDQIEEALVSRPGRIDQAIEFPLPDDDGRAKLTKLYARGLQVPEEILEQIVTRTKGVSAAFIRELMRRCAQSQIEMFAGDVLSQASLDSALEEMLFAGGSLNRRLLGGQEAKV